MHARSTNPLSSSLSQEVVVITGKYEKEKKEENEKEKEKK